GDLRRGRRDPRIAAAQPHRAARPAPDATEHRHGRLRGAAPPRAAGRRGAQRPARELKLPEEAAMLIVCPHCLTTNRVPDARLQDAPTCGHCGRELLGEAPVALDDASFDKVVARTELPVVVDFWADWCG